MLSILFFSCKNEVLEAFEDENNLILDSIEIYNSLSNRLLEQIWSDDVKIKSEYAEFIYFIIEDQNKQIDSLLILLQEKAVNRNDRTVSTKYLVKQGRADELRKQNRELVEEIERVDLLAIPQAAKKLFLESITGNSENWANQKFKNMPMIVSVTFLNRWKLNNSKASTLILLKLKDKFFKDDITDKNTRRI